MAKGFKHGASGTPLNFKVVGGTSAPSSPSENTIWVNTSTTITSYVFSATQPTGATGMVWLQTGTTSSAAFNALKKNTINVYPSVCKQYVSNAWVSKTAKIYQSGKWVDLIFWLYNQGDECANVTGGWKGVYDATGYYSKGTITKNAQNITVSLSGIQLLVPSCVNTINLTEQKTLKINVLSRTSNLESTVLAVWPTNKPQNHGEWIASKEFTTTGVISLDVTSLSGAYKVGVLCAQSSGNGVFSFDKVWCEWK